ncbi:UDP-glucose 4-epimerase GalE [Paenibacillus sp. BSR1-1]|uniref:UDP-glucose 4-epimerase GalE n=1 Tax=Paenibacillus sp. BSR1-1 TaxID=3020845 RepID=UPI0025B0DD23|nr:UDP-glucose 4-epimerase GalE [Paenibacillus sp. BSR1-1]MDN3017854.1 UDP-glucose 4-epimerase GalE [Paenibacillus sp. BSR1-1]
MILITGGAGYIGSHVVRDLADKGYSVLVLDNLSTGHVESVDERAIFIRGDMGDRGVLEEIFAAYPIKAVMHFAGSCLVGESVNFPLKYYHNNVSNTVQLLHKMIEHKIRSFIFSSTCATYGIPNQETITEFLTPNPINPYGKSKLMIETILNSISEIYDFQYITLRYFNVAGAHHTGEIGEDHNPESHLIPNILGHLQGKTPYIEIFGDDYPTPDGTCIRDYIHVTDLSEGHILALEYLLQSSSQKIAETFNLGNERGVSVLEMIKLCEQVTGVKAYVKMQPRRIGDPPRLVASSRKIKDMLGWSAKYDIKTTIETAWNWYQKHPNGYKEKNNPHQ